MRKLKQAEVTQLVRHSIGFDLKQVDSLCSPGGIQRRNHESQDCMRDGGLEKMDELKGYMKTKMNTSL